MGQGCRPGLVWANPSLLRPPPWGHRCAGHVRPASRRRGRQRTAWHQGAAGCCWGNRGNSLLSPSLSFLDCEVGRGQLCEACSCPHPSQGLRLKNGHSLAPHPLPLTAHPEALLVGPQAPPARPPPTPRFPPASLLSPPVSLWGLKMPALSCLRALALASAGPKLVFAGRPL